jgi:DNA invertase Pin-like site-specific DNA recombinase
MRPGDTLVVWKLDRLARSLKQVIETVEGLEERNVGFQSLTEKIDTTSPGGKLIFHIFGALAEFERGLIRERTMAGLASARARGRLGGRPRRFDEEKIDVARALLSQEGFTAEKVAKQVGVSVSTLYRHLPAAKSVA